MFVELKRVMYCFIATKNTLPIVHGKCDLEEKWEYMTSPKLPPSINDGTN
jgi:hypothetical protein